MSTLIQITNISKQVITILINSIEEHKANPNSNVPHNKGGVYHMTTGSSMTIELERINANQLNQLQHLGQITYK